MRIWLGLVYYAFPFRFRIAFPLGFRHRRRRSRR